MRPTESKNGPRSSPGDAPQHVEFTSKSTPPISTTLRPCALQVRPGPIPGELKRLVQWVAWQYRWNADRRDWSKVPVQAIPILRDPPTWRYAATTKPSTWATFDEALRAYELNPPRPGTNMPTATYENGGLDGIGLCLTTNDPYVVIDLDKCLEDGALTGEQARQVLEWMAGTYTEMSPSATGLHIFARGVKPGKRSRRGALEIYDGSSGRYLTVTGHEWEPA